MTIRHQLTSTTNPSHTLARSSECDRVWRPSSFGGMCVHKSLGFFTLAVLSIGYAFMPAKASSHREAPLISADPQADTTDVYAFVSPDDPNTVTLISSWIPFENPQGGPNFYHFGDGVRYEFKIDQDGDG